MEEFDFPAELKKLTVLYVEDDKDILESLERPLRRRVGVLETAPNGKLGLEKFKEVLPDIVITDIRMPVMDGLEMSHGIKETFAKTPIIVTTAFDETQFFIDAIDIGINQYVLKPIDINKLMKSLEHCVRQLTLERSVIEKTEELKVNVKMLTEYKNAVEVSSIVSKSDATRTITYVNDEFCKITGFEREELTGKTHGLIRDPDTPETFYDDIRETLAEKEVWKGIVKNRRKDGEPFWCNLTIVPIVDENDNIVEFIDFRQEVTGLINRIITDPLTGYPNRAALAQELADAVDPAVVVFNIDSFKDINDFYGNEAGDYILKGVVQVMDAYLKEKMPGATIYKLSGDEFAVLVEGVTDPAALKGFIEAFDRYLESYPFKYAENEFNLSFTSGFSLSKEQILPRADMALKHAKKLKLDAVCFEEVEDIKKTYHDNIFWSKKVKKAIEEDRIVPFFQPIFNNETEQAEKYEALIRLIDEDGKVITPYHFLEVAGRSRLLFKLTEIMVEKSCLAFRDNGHHFSFNLTASMIQNRDIVEYVKAKLTEHGVAQRAVVELTESEGIEEYEVIRDFIVEMKALGCKVAIDDFGTGYSNFEHILRLDVDFIKIDGSMIKTIDQDENSRIIAKTIADFAKKLGVKTIAEFVHSEQVYMIAREIGIDYSQGFYLGEPSPDLLS